jgi:hypothetical protein
MVALQEVRAEQQQHLCCLRGHRAPTVAAAEHLGSLHEALLKERSGDLAVNLVDVTHPKVQALYETWGYAKVGEQQPFADSPR